MLPTDLASSGRNGRRQARSVIGFSDYPLRRSRCPWPSTPSLCRTAFATTIALNLAGLTLFSLDQIKRRHLFRQEMCPTFRHQQANLRPNVQRVRLVKRQATDEGRRSKVLVRSSLPTTTGLARPDNGQTDLCIQDLCRLRAGAFITFWAGPDDPMWAFLTVFIVSQTDSGLVLFQRFCRILGTIDGLLYNSACVRSLAQ